MNRETNRIAIAALTLLACIACARTSEPPPEVVPMRTRFRMVRLARSACVVTSTSSSMSKGLTR